MRDTTPGVYLHHRSDLGDFQLSSDAVIATFIRYAATARVIGQVPQAEHDEFDRLGYTMGGMMVFPGNKVDGKLTLNAARGFNRKISDGWTSPWSASDATTGTRTARSARTSAVRRLLRPVRGLPGLRRLLPAADLASADYETVRFFMPFNDFDPAVIPRDLHTYLEFRRLSIEFTEARNRRIDQLALEVD